MAFDGLKRKKYEKESCNKWRNQIRLNKKDDKLLVSINISIQSGNFKENINKYHKHTQASISPTYTQQVVIIHPLFQSIMLSMMHAPDLKSQMQCGTIRKEIT